MVNRLDRQQHEVVVKRGGRRHDHDEHGGAWKVAFADFCLALMCLFLVMWVLAARNQEEMQRALGQGAGSSIVPTVGEANPTGSLIPREPMPTRAMSARDAQARQIDTDTGSELKTAKELEAVASRVKSIADDIGLSNNIRLVVTAQGLRIVIHDTDREGMFEVGSVKPRAKFSLLLRRIGPLFQRVGNQMLIVGHTDARRYAGQDLLAASNWSLSASRALAAQSQLMSGGMPERNVLQVMGMGEVALMDTAHPLAAVNRRVELLVMTEEHAKTISATFGMLDRTEPFATGVVSSVADTSPLKLLRAALLGEPAPKSGD